jgi:Flp pilus assembly pilin Flp
LWFKVGNFVKVESHDEFPSPGVPVEKPLVHVDHAEEPGRTVPIKTPVFIFSEPHADVTDEESNFVGNGASEQMIRISKLIWSIRIWRDIRGQDMIEYALMAGFVAVAAGAVVPGVTSIICTIFSKVTSVMTVAASQS